MNRSYDFCVLGAGSAGYNAAVAARKLGKSVALVDGTGQLAGLCILRGCMPSKALLRSADIAYLVRTATQVGIQPLGFRADVPAIVQRKDRMIREFAEERTAGIMTFPFFAGTPHFVSADQLAVNGDVISADRFLVSTGSLVSVPDIPGLSETGYLTSDDVLDLTSLPASIVVLGGGAVACELAQYLARLGVHTTVLQRSRTLLSSEDPEVGEAVRAAFERDGIRVLTGVHVRHVERDGSRKRIVADVDGISERFEADELFAALGRRPNVEGFGLQAAGVEYDFYGIKVDTYLQTSNPRVYAAGDVTGFSRELVHLAVYEGELVARNVFDEAKRKPVDYELYGSRAIFTEPQVAIAGRNERECRERGIEFISATYSFRDHGKAIVANLTDGFVKMLSTRQGRILGITYVSAEASDLIAEAIALIHFKATAKDVLDMPHLHPTMAEILTYPAEMLAERVPAT
ncbi:MAG: dihydrolipoyl dehydrogenase [Candidatus Eremiobacteraeota bacterium]|nr:dihydrolipoyl dehydrogenase [Candidatus Eremiobacteraeota bacterium]